MARAIAERERATPTRDAGHRISPLQKLVGATSVARTTQHETPRLRFNVLADAVSTYLTLFSALLLPLLLILWGRSYMVNDRIYRADDGVAMVAGVANG